MIFGHGIDLQEISAVKKAMTETHVLQRKY